ncbi:MAG: methyl-accepting chemotaxis protein [Cyanobacteria bacterium P01_E01_bin.45]
MMPNDSPQPTPTTPSIVRRSSNRLLVPITVIAGLSLVLVGVSTVNVIRTYRSFRTTVRTDFRLNELSGSIIHIDEVLTMSARMAVSTGDPTSRWETRYNEFVPLLDDAIKETIELAPEFANSSEQVDEANIALVDMEVRAFELLGQDRTPEAFELLFSPEYERQKQIYAAGIQDTLTNIKNANALRLRSYRRSLSWAAVLAGLSVPMLLGSWGVVLWLTRNYIRERNVSQRSLEQSRGQLLQLNEQLEDQVLRRAEQEQAMRWESEVLQQDVGTILNVVAAVEMGDLTVSAPVSDGVTGLVADTLNRLIEGLDSVLSTTFNAARVVTHRSVVLEQLALSTAEQAKQQTMSVNGVRQSMEQATELAQDTARQAIAANQVVQQAQQSITSGQQDMQTIERSVSALQEGTDRAVQRADTLGEFVKLAAQFAREQKRVASLTRVLAMNASMLASRASGQQDPEQFVNVANEFATIAKQVNELAVETNQGLLALQQRTDRMQTVVSGLDRDIHDIGDRVTDVFAGVERSQQAFDSIQVAAEQVVQAGEHMSQSSQTIANSARVTLEAVRSISDIASDTAQRADTTRERSVEMEQLAQSLLHTVEFFQLRSVDESALLPAAEPPSESDSSGDVDASVSTDATISTDSTDPESPPHDTDRYPYATIV